MKLNDFQRNLINAGYTGSFDGTSQMCIFVSPSNFEKHIVVTVEEEFDILGIQNDMDNLYRSLLHQYDRYGTERILFVVFTPDTQGARMLTQNEYDCWLYNTIYDNLEITESQQREFYNVKVLFSQLDLIGRDVTVKRPQPVRRIHRVWNLTNLFIALNVLVHIFLCIKGDTTDVEFMLDNGGLYPDAIRKGEVYRFISSMFMHFDWIHLIGNMFVLFMVGRNLENMVGKVRFPIIYLGSGINAGIVAAMYYYITEKNVVCVGASGAVYGLVGALLWVLIANKNRRQEMTLWQVIVGLVLSLGAGATEEGVSVAAHVGGLIFGFLIALIAYRRTKA